MQVVRFCGTSVNDIYLVLTQDDSKLGDHEGLAHWNGVAWRWLQRLDKGFITDIRVTDGGLTLLDARGAISIWKTNGQWERDAMRAPDYVCTAPPNKTGTTTYYSSCLPLSGEAMLAAGTYGELLLFRNREWTRIETNTSEDLDYVFGTADRAYVCGTKGTILCVAGSRCHSIESGTTRYLLHIDCGLDGTWFVTGGGNEGPLIQIENDKVVAHHKVSGSINTLAAVSRTEVYCAMFDQNLLVWNGIEFTTTLSADLRIARVAKLGRSVAAATGLRGQNALYVNGPHWEKIDIALDESFLL